MSGAGMSEATIGPRWVPEAAGLAAAVVVAVLAVLVIGPLALPDEPAEPPPLTVTTSQRQNTPPPPPASTEPQPRPTTPPQPVIQAPELPALATDLQLPTVDDHVEPVLDWQAALPGAPMVAGPSAPAPTTGIGDQPAQRLVTPDLGSFYPYRAQRRAVEGITTVRVHWDARGEVTAVEVLASEPPGVFEEAARKAAKQLTYQPAIQDGNPVGGSTEESFEWKIR